MRYQAPFGVLDQNAGYINGDPSVGRQGSIPPAAAFEEPMREIVAVITDAGFTPSDTDLAQLAKAIQQGLNYAVDTGSQNAMVVALNPALPPNTPYTPGLVVRVKMLFSNIHDTNHQTLTLDAGGGPFPVKRMDGSIPATNDCPASGIGEFTFDGTQWQMINFLGVGGSGGSTFFTASIPYCVDTSNAPAVVNAAFSPAITSLTPGQLVMVKKKGANPGATTILVNALASAGIVQNSGTLAALAASAAPDGMIMILVWDGAQWRLANQAAAAGGGAAGPGVTGQIIWTSGNAPLTGTLKLNGALVSRTTFAALWSFAQSSGAIVTDAQWTNNANGLWGSFSQGDGSTTFRLPDYRGEFLRNFDDGRGVDTGRNLGKWQAADVAASALSVSISQNGACATDQFIVTAQNNGSCFVIPGDPDRGSIVCYVSISGSISVNTGGVETRPRNVAPLACIVF